MNGFGLPKARKLVKTDEISSVFSFNSRVTSEHFQVLAKPGVYKFARIAVIVSKKTARLATDRNYIKRVSREIFRLEQQKLAGLDIIIRIRRRFSSTEYAEIANELREQLGRTRLKFIQEEEQATS